MSNLTDTGKNAVNKAATVSTSTTVENTAEKVLQGVKIMTPGEFVRDGRRWFRRPDGIEQTVVDVPLQKRLIDISADQKAHPEEYHTRWLANCVNTDEADWNSAKIGVFECYKRASLATPMMILEAESPTAALLAGPVANLIMQQRSNPNKTIESAMALITKAVAELRKTDDRINDISLDNVEKCLKSADYAAHGKTTFADKASTLVDIKSAVRNEGFQYRLLQPWSGWYGYCAFVRECLGLDMEQWNDYLPDEQAARSCHLVWYGEKVAVVCNRPSSMSVESQDDQNNTNRIRFHNEDGPVLKYRNKPWALYYIHGFQVDKQIVEAPQTQTVEQIEKEGNQEIKRIRIERFVS